MSYCSPGFFGKGVIFAVFDVWVKNDDREKSLCTVYCTFELKRISFSRRRRFVESFSHENSSMKERLTPIFSHLNWPKIGNKIETVKAKIFFIWNVFLLGIFFIWILFCTLLHRVLENQLKIQRSSKHENARSVHHHKITTYWWKVKILSCLPSMEKRHLGRRNYL